MSDEEQQTLTPAEQHEQDEGRVTTQLVVTDMTEAAGKVMATFGFGNFGAGGRTSFEGHELNTMIDLVENSNPADLESAGEALWKARDAIREAARELGDHLTGVDWHGESGNAFRDWGKGLVAHAVKLGDFADAAGTQITVAGTGLASVRSSMPPRDSRLVRKNVDDIELPAQIASNPEYAAALKVEKNRQEAINQVNRLASYYSVSEESLAGQELPKFDKKLDVAMPRPQGFEEDSSYSGSSSASTEAPRGGTTQEITERTTIGGSSGAGISGGRSSAEVLGTTPVLDESTSIEIDSVAAPSVPARESGAQPTPPTTSTTGPGGATQPIAPGFGNPVQGSSSRPTGRSGVPRSVSQASGGAGKARATGGGPATNERAGGPVGRPGAMGGGPTPTGRSGAGGQSPPVGRSGVTGGRPMTGHAGTSASAGPRAGRGNGIVGGSPQRAAAGPASGTGAARGVPRGAVIGAQGAAQTRNPSGNAGQRGVIGGTGATNGAPRPAGRGTPTPGVNGVVGTPRGTSRSGPSSKGFTAGGAGLVRGPAGRRDSDREDEENTGSTRPDYLTEDEETWTVQRRGAVPPVIE